MATIMQSATKDGFMGTWDIGPFDNDSAADWCGDLDDAASSEREPILAQRSLPSSTWRAISTATWWLTSRGGGAGKTLGWGNQVGF